MKVYRSTKEAAGHLRSPAVAIGNFDGVHRGHQALFAQTIELAQHHGKDAVALTFEPHPARYFNPQLAPPLLTNEEQKLELLAAHGLDAVIIEPFDQALAKMKAEEFVEQVLVKRLHVSHVIVGHNFLFGHDRLGSHHTLTQLGAQRGFCAHGTPEIMVKSLVVSSSKIREFLFLGRVMGAAMLLGRDYYIDGRVVEGKARGRTFGVPTANIAASNELLPKPGVYTGFAQISDDEIFQAVINVWFNPTFETNLPLTLEAHLLDFSENLYGKNLRIHFSQRLRDERKFSSVEALVAAINQDILDARALFQQNASEKA